MEGNGYFRLPSSIDPRIGGARVLEGGKELSSQESSNDPPNSNRAVDKPSSASGCCRCNHVQAKTASRVSCFLHLSGCSHRNFLRIVSDSKARELFGLLLRILDLRGHQSGAGIQSHL